MNPIEFARNLFLLRREHNMTVEDLADALGVTPELICQWECAKTSPSLDQMTRLAKIYGIPLAHVIRDPQPHDVTVADPIPEPEPAPAEPEEEPEKDVPPPPEVIPQKKRSRVAEFIIIALLLAIIAVGIVALARPEWFPFKAWFGSVLPALPFPRI